MKIAGVATVLAASVSEARMLAINYTRPLFQQSLAKRLTGGPGRGDCHRFANGAAPLPDKNSWESFVKYYDESTYIKEAAKPANYEMVFEDYDSTVVSPPDYLGVYTMYDYDIELCAEICNDEPGCQAFNVYVSRDPSKDPGPKCPNPPATANFKCSLFSAPIDPSLATNPGQFQPPADANGQEFVVKVKISNAYNKISGAHSTWEPSTSLKLIELNGYEGPYRLPGAVDDSVPNAPEKLLEAKIFHSRFDPSICSRICDFVSQTNLLAVEEGDFSTKSSTYAQCSYFNAYAVVDENGNGESFYCALFAGEMPRSTSVATIASIKDTAGNKGKVTVSWGYRTSPTDERSIPDDVVDDDEPAPDSPTFVAPVVHALQPISAIPAVEDPAIENPDVEDRDVEDPDIEDPDVEDPDAEDPAEYPCATVTTTETWLKQDPYYTTATTTETWALQEPYTTTMIQTVTVETTVPAMETWILGAKHYHTRR